MTTEKTSIMLLAIICLTGIAVLAIAQSVSIVTSDDSNQTVNITAWYPLDDNINDIEGATRAFNVSINQTVTVSWRINGAEVLNQSGVNSSEYVASAAAGYWNVTAYVHNENGSAVRTWRWTVTVKDTTPPAVISHAPTGTKVSVKTDITATFNEPMNPLSLNNATLIVCDSSGSSVTGDITYDSKTVTFDPLSELEYNETYNVTITTGVQDHAGNNMSLDFCWHFTTRREILRTPIVISGYVTKNGTWLLNPVVTITNLDTGDNFTTVETHPNSSYYRLWTDSTHVSAGDTLRFSVSTGEIIIDRNVTEAEIENGGFRQDLPGMPDLVITNYSEEWVDPGNKTSFNINFTIENIGSEDASESNASIYLECSNGIAMKNYSIKPLAPSENKTHTVGPFTCPCRDIKICADSDDTLAERNETNNCRETLSNCPLPDLQISSFGGHLKWTDKVNGRYNIHYIAQNWGHATAAPSNTTINITAVASNGSVVSSVIVRDQVPALSPHFLSGNYRDINNLGPFTCLCNHTIMIKICVDGDNEILESCETDNCHEVSFNCTYERKPDLKIVNHREIWINRTNRTFNINYTVANIGNVNASASITNISKVNYDDTVPALAPDESYSNTIGPFKLSSFRTTVNISADYYNNVSESNEGNNYVDYLFGLPYLKVDLCAAHWVDGKNKTFRVGYRVWNNRDVAGATSNRSILYAYIDGERSNVTDTVPPIRATGHIFETMYLDSWGIGPLQMPKDKDTVEYKLCIDRGDGVETCTPEIVFGGAACIAEDGTPFTFGGAWGAISQGPVEITESCKFNGDVYYPYGMCIGAPDIVIDGNGSGIIGDRRSAISAADDFPERLEKTGVHNGRFGRGGHDNVTIKNMEIRQFCSGIGIEAADYNRIENCSVHDNGVDDRYHYGIFVRNSNHTVINNCSVYNNTGILTTLNVCGGHGINFHDGCNYGAVTNSHVFHNYLSGIIASPTCKYINIANNIIEENGYCNESAFCAGINLHWKGGYGIATNSTVENNVILNNTGSGIYVTQGYTTIMDNLVRGSKNGTNVTGNGLLVDGGRVTFLYNNTCCDNEGSDIVNHGFASYGDDNTCDTTDNYDDEGTRGCNFYCRGVNGICVGATRNFSCGDIVTERCAFNRSMSCRGCAGDGLIIGASDITIDGAGYALTGDGDFTGIKIFGNHNDVTIQNLQVEDFSTGIEIRNVRGNTIENCTVRTNCLTGINFSANNGTVRNNMIYDNVGPGILIGGANSTFENNTVARNKNGTLLGYGVYFSSEAKGNNITANAIGDNEVMDIYNDDGASNFEDSDNNTCDTTYNYGDVRMQEEKKYRCTYPWTPPDLIISNKFEEWVDKGSACYSVTYTVGNIGKSNSRPAERSTTYLYLRGALVAKDSVGPLTASENYTSTFNDTQKILEKEESNIIKVCADGAEEVVENNDANTFYGNDVVFEYYNLVEYYELNNEENNCLENTLYKNPAVIEWNNSAVCDAGGGVAYRCGDEVYKSCTFTGNMECPTGHGLIISTGVVIDGDGYVIGRDTTSCACLDEANPANVDCGILNIGHDDVTIQNLKIMGFCNGIGLNDVEGNKIVNNCDIWKNGNGHGIHMANVQHSTISNNDIHDNTGVGALCSDGGNGIFMYRCSHNDITGNTIHNNRKGGICMKASSKSNSITDNPVVSENGEGGIILRCKSSDNNMIERNIVSGNYGDGIYIGSNDNIIRDNTVENNKGEHRVGSGSIEDGVGIDISRSDGSRNNELYGNTVCDNEGMDIRTLDEDYGNIGDNNYCDTTDNYDDSSVEKGGKCANPCSKASKPDLEVTEKFETWFVEGESYNVTYTVQNIGKANALASTTLIQIVGVEEPKFYQVPTLQPTESYTDEVGPFTMSGDSDTITVCADYEGIVEKQGLSSRDNNCRENTWWALPDLIVTDISVPDRLSFGMSNIITAKIENAGTVRTNGTFTVALFIVPSTEPIDTAPAPPELTAGSSTTVELSWAPPAPGRYTLRVVADYGDAIPESNEDNNEKTKTITEELGIEMPEGPKGGGGGGGVPTNKEIIYGSEVATGEISTGEATKEVPVNETKQVKEEKKMGTGHPFGEGGMIETVKVVAPVFLVVALITIVAVLFYLGYQKEKKMHKRGDKKIR